MYVDHYLQPPLLNKGTMLFSLMIFLVDVGSTLLRRRIRTSLGFVSLKPRKRKNLGKK